MISIAASGSFVAAPVVTTVADDPELKFNHPLLRDMLAYWHAKRGTRPMPSRADIDPMDLKAHLGWIALVDVAGVPARFRYRLIGSGITAVLGRDSTGRFMDDLYPPEICEQATRSYRRLLQTRMPNRVVGTMRQAGKDWINFESVDLPLSDDGTQVNMILTRTIFA